MNPKREDIVNQQALYKAIENEDVAVVNGVVSRVNEWKIEKVLGRGATATVYLGTSLLNGSSVAIKVFNADLLDHEEHSKANEKMMYTEAALVGRIFHPNILQTLTVGMNSKNKYLVMEVVDMGCFDDYINPPKNFSISELVRIFFQIGAALQYSDEIGVIHRDIKPANILMKKGVMGAIPKVTDFGSSMVKGMDKDAVSGVGSPAYMAPEQIMDKPLNQQADIYALGQSLFEMITGKKAITATNMRDMAMKIVYEPTPSLTKYIASRLPPGLDDIIQKCTQKNTVRRYQTWADYLHDMVKMYYAITPIAKLVKVIDEVSAFDWVRGSPAMAIFEDSELWDLIALGAIYRVPCGAAFTISPVQSTVEGSPQKVKDAGVSAMNLGMEYDEERSRPINVSGQSTVHSFVLSGALQSYDNGDDKRIQILRSGDYIAHLQILETYSGAIRPGAYAIDDTILISVEDSDIAQSHTMITEKLNRLIRDSQDNQQAMLKQRHAKSDIHQAVKDASRGMRLL